MLIITVNFVEGTTKYTGMSAKKKKSFLLVHWHAAFHQTMSDALLIVLPFLRSSRNTELNLELICCN